MVNIATGSQQKDRGSQNGLLHGSENLGDRSYIQSGYLKKNSNIFGDLLLEI